MEINLSFDTKKAEMKELDDAYREYTRAYVALWAALQKTSITNLDVCAMHVEGYERKE